MKVPDIIIAIDGYSSTGKSTFAKLIASRLGFLYLDSGAMYRALTLFSLRKGLIDGSGTVDAEGLRACIEEADLDFKYSQEGSRTYLDGECVEQEIRSMEVSSHVSAVSALDFVRNFVDRRLREFGKSGRIVMDGRDIGTTVFPNAQLKIFMTADAMVRAERRAAELELKGQKTDINEVLENLKNRDWADSHREVSPLRQAEDAIVLDNSHMTLEEQMTWIEEIIRNKFAVED